MRDVGERELSQSVHGAGRFKLTAGWKGRERKSEQKATCAVAETTPPATPTEPAKRPLPRPGDSPLRSGAAARERLEGSAGATRKS